MTSPEHSRYDDQLVIQYLLGDVPADEAERLDELSIVDDEFAVRLNNVENDLVDAYVRGELAGATRERFQSHYLCSPRRREKVNFAESLMVLSDRAPVPATADVRAPGWRWPHLSPVFAAAMCLLLIAAGFLTYQNILLRTQLLQTQQQRAALEHREREAKNQHEKQGENSNLPPGERPGIAVAIVLVPQTRGIGPLPAIAIPAETSQADFRLELESADFKEYRVQLKFAAAGQILWQSGTVKPESHDGVRSVSLALPGRLLKPRNYVLELSAISPKSGEWLSSYAFTVVP
jgi:hypothetical protein